MRLTGLRRVAVHEAGHVVAAYLVGRSFRYVTIIPDPDKGTLGHAQFRPSPGWFHPDYVDDARTRKRIEGEIITSFGGEAAIAVVTGRNKFDARQPDIGEAIDFASYATGSTEETGAYATWLWVRTMKLLQRPHHLAAVNAIADALLARKRLSATNARALIKAAIHRAATQPT